MNTLIFFSSIHSFLLIIYQCITTATCVKQIDISDCIIPRLVASPRLKNLVCPTILPIAGGRIIGFIPFPRVLVLCEMQSVAVSNSCDDNHYTSIIRHRLRVSGTIKAKEWCYPLYLGVVTVGKEAFGAPSTTVGQFTYLSLSVCTFIRIWHLKQWLVLFKIYDVVYHVFVAIVRKVTIVMREWVSGVVPTTFFCLWGGIFYRKVIMRHFRYRRKNTGYILVNISNLKIYHYRFYATFLPNNAKGRHTLNVNVSNRTARKQPPLFPAKRVLHRNIKFLKATDRFDHVDWSVLFLAFSILFLYCFLFESITINSGNVLIIFSCLLPHSFILKISTAHASRKRFR